MDDGVRASESFFTEDVRGTRAAPLVEPLEKAGVTGMEEDLRVKPARGMKSAANRAGLGVVDAVVEVDGVAAGGAFSLLVASPAGIGGFKLRS